MIPSNYSSALLSSIHFACVAKATTTPKKNCINQNPFAKPIIQQLGSSWTTPLENWKSSIFYMDFNKGAIHFSKLSV